MISPRLCGEWDTKKKKIVMSNWYKRATRTHDLTFVITTWLRNARNTPETAGVNDDLSYQMSGADNEHELSAAITTATSIVSAEQGGQLTPSQQELVQNLQARNGSVQQQDPFAMPQMQMPEINPIGSLEQPNPGMGQSNEMGQF